jgi:hypothetical protein
VPEEVLAGVVPRPDPQPDGLAALAQQLVVLEHGRQEHVVPARDHRDRDAEVGQDRAEVGRRPVRVAGLVVGEPVPVVADGVANGGGVGVDQREMVEGGAEVSLYAQRGAEERERAFLVLDRERPAEAVEGERAAGIGVGAALGGADAVVGG